MTIYKEVLQKALEILNIEGFSLEVGNLYFSLKDGEGANLGNIEKRKFSDLAEVIDSLDTYHNDYIYNDKEMAEYADFLNDDITYDILMMINPRTYHQIIRFGTIDMAEIGDFY